MKILGLKIVRYVEWLGVVKEGAKRGGIWRASVKMVRAMMTGKVGRKVWRERIRKGCGKCPIYSRRVCAMVDGDRELGCGCYVPFLALVKAPYEAGCWVREVVPGSGLGWGVDESGKKNG